MLRIVAVLISVLSFSEKAVSLEMTTAVNTNEKLIYMNLWGQIVPGDDQKFRSTVLPLIQSGNVLFKVNLFTGGGNVQAAMGIGDQVRILKATTVAPMRMAIYANRQPVLTNSVQCWFWSSISGFVTNNDPKNIVKRDIQTNTGPSWCDCASACFLIWSNGLARTGNWVGVHRFKFDEVFFGGLPAAQAQELYEKAESEFKTYLAKVDVPQSITERLFATPSTSMHYLTAEELQLAMSTPYLEELTQARCGSTKAKTTWQGNSWTYAEDPNHINCYRSTLKEIMVSGAHEYLTKYDSR
jgi:hypothetical protein